MEARGVWLMFCLLLLAHGTVQQTNSKKRNGKKDSANNAAIEELRKQINDIVQELNLLKEQQALQTVCLKGIKFHDKCFLADPEKKTFHAASEDCMAKGGRLSTPRSALENHRLYEYVLESIDQDAHIWVGINDLVNEDEWVDQTGSVMGFKNWERDLTVQPDGGRRQNCAVLYTASVGKWFDESCSDKKASVCEFNIV